MLCGVLQAVRGMLRAVLQPGCILWAACCMLHGSFCSIDASRACANGKNIIALNDPSMMSDTKGADPLQTLTIQYHAVPYRAMRHLMSARKEPELPTPQMKQVAPRRLHAGAPSHDCGDWRFGSFAHAL